MIDLRAIDTIGMRRSRWLPYIRCNAANHPIQPSGEVRRFEVDDQPSPPADRQRSASEVMLYPDGSSVQAGDLIWWDEGNCVGFVQEVIETEANQRKWGLTHPHISIGGHPYRPGAPGFVMCPASVLADEGIGRLTADDCAQLNRAMEHAQTQAGVDLSIVDFDVKTEVRDGVQTAWLITIKPTGQRKKWCNSSFR